MNLTEAVRTAEVMRKYGGRFMRSLVEPLQFADENNRQRILDAFPEIADGYGPGTAAFRALHGDTK